MFRKSKKQNKGAIRKKKREDEEEDDDDETSDLLQEARAVNNHNNKKIKTHQDDDSDEDNNKPLMQQYQATTDARPSEKDLATSTAQHHPEESSKDQEATGQGKGADGIYRDKTQNAFHAGPLKAPTFVRTTVRFDYQPDICKDYKDTGFCGFGDTCIYLHDRGDTLTGWQLEQQWEEQRKQDQAKRELDAFVDGKQSVEKERIASNDDLPFACFLCRNAFTEPVVTSCGHYFCQRCIRDHVQNNTEACPICKADTHGVFNQPTKLISKKRKLLSSKATWQEFYEFSQTNGTTEDT